MNQRLLLEDLCFFQLFSTPNLLFFHTISKYWKKIARKTLTNRPLRVGIDVPKEYNITKTKSLLGNKTIQRFLQLQKILKNKWKYPYLALPPDEFELPETGEYGRDRRLNISDDNIQIHGAPPTENDYFPTKIDGQFHLSSTNVVLCGLSLKDSDIGGVGVFVVGKKNRFVDQREERNCVEIRACEISFCDFCAVRVSYSVHCIIDQCFIHHNRNGIELFATMDIRFHHRQREQRNASLSKQRKTDK